MGAAVSEKFLFGGATWVACDNWFPAFLSIVFCIFIRKICSRFARFDFGFGLFLSLNAWLLVLALVGSSSLCRRLLILTSAIAGPINAAISGSWGTYEGL